MTGRTPEDLQRIVDSAHRAGIELDSDEAARWLSAVSASGTTDDLTLSRSGVFGHRVAMLDFSDADLRYFRTVGALVEFADEPDVETALALSGSAAQSRVQTYPGDCDFFERVNILADTRRAACRRLAGLIRGKALATRDGPTYHLLEVKFGSYPQDLVRDGALHRAGSAISWSPAEVEAGCFVAMTTAGEQVGIGWDDVADDPGWCKLDWVVADPVRRQLANASNMLDVTWEAPDGSITPLDGYLDPYFQEVYLDVASIPLFSKLAQQVSADALDEYVAQLEKEVRKYVHGEPPNYGKAAKRMYNVFRLSGRYPEAAFIREIFDEPATVLYQVYSLLRTVEEASEPGSSIPKAAVLDQLDEVIRQVVRALEGEEEEEIVAHLLVLRESIEAEARLDARSQAVRAARERIINLVNNFFHEKLSAMPQVHEYMEGLADG